MAPVAGSTTRCSHRTAAAARSCASSSRLGPPSRRLSHVATASTSRSSRWYPAESCAKAPQGATSRRTRDESRAAPCAASSRIAEEEAAHQQPGGFRDSVVVVLRRRVGRGGGDPARVQGEHLPGGRGGRGGSAQQRQRRGRSAARAAPLPGRRPSSGRGRAGWRDTTRRAAPPPARRARRRGRAGPPAPAAAVLPSDCVPRRAGCRPPRRGPPTATARKGRSRRASRLAGRAQRSPAPRRHAGSPRRMAGLVAPPPASGARRRAAAPSRRGARAPPAAGPLRRGAMPRAAPGADPGAAPRPAVARARAVFPLQGSVLYSLSEHQCRLFPAWLQASAGVGWAPSPPLC